MEEIYKEIVQTTGDEARYIDIYEYMITAPQSLPGEMRIELPVDLWFGVADTVAIRTLLPQQQQKAVRLLESGVNNWLYEPNAFRAKYMAYCDRSIGGMRIAEYE